MPHGERREARMNINNGADAISGTLVSKPSSGSLGCVAA